MPVNRTPHACTRQIITLYGTADATKLCALGSVVSEMWLFNASSIKKKIHSIWMKNEHTRLNMGKIENVIIYYLKSITFYAKIRKQ